MPVPSVPVLPAPCVRPGALDVLGPLRCLALHRLAFPLSPPRAVSASRPRRSGTPCPCCRAVLFISRLPGKPWNRAVRGIYFAPLQGCMSFACFEQLCFGIPPPCDALRALPTACESPARGAPAFPGHQFPNHTDSALHELAISTLVGPRPHDRRPRRRHSHPCLSPSVSFFARHQPCANHPPHPVAWFLCHAIGGLT